MSGLHCGMQDLCLLHEGSVVAAWSSDPAACGILVSPSGIEPASPALEGGFLTIGPLGKSWPYSSDTSQPPYLCPFTFSCVFISSDSVFSCTDFFFSHLGKPLDHPLMEAVYSRGKVQECCSKELSFNPGSPFCILQKGHPDRDC